MFDTIANLPLHAVVVHATVVVVPVAALTVLLAALWPRFRRWAGLLPAALALLALVLVPVSTQSGEALEERVGESAAVETHAELGEGLLPWVIVLAVVGLVLAWAWWQGRTPRGADGSTGTRRALPGGRAVALGLVVAALVGSVGTGVQVVRIGHSGAEAVWQETMVTTPVGDTDDDDD